MTNVNADSANDTAMTRSQMQTEAVIIESLLVAVQALASVNMSDALNLVEMATARAQRLNRALDSVNCSEVAS